MIDKKSKIVIIGGAISGMSLAYFLSQANFKDITIIEKRKEYTRKQIISVNNKVYFALLPLEVRNNIKNKCFISELVTNANYECAPNNNPDEHFFHNLSIQLSDLEKIYYNFIKKKINFIHAEIIKINSKKIILKDFELDYDVLIGADGAHSQVREEFFNNKITKILPFDTYFAGYFKFNIKPIKKVKINKTLGVVQHLFRGFPESSPTHYTINIILSKEQYNLLKDNNINNPKRGE